MGGVKTDFASLKKFQDKLKQLNKQQSAQFTEEAVKELAARLLRRVKERTPVGDYSGEPYPDNRRVKDGPLGEHTHEGWKTEGKTGGTLRRGWTVGEVIREGDSYSIEVINPTHYALYVEYGHRKGESGWEKGHFMLTVSEQELRDNAPKILENKLKKFLEGIVNAK